MTVKTCLLVTDDPDDHQAFSEAFSDVSREAIVLNVLDSVKALQLLKAQKYIPDYFFIDLSMHGIRINAFLKIIGGDPTISKIPTVLYGHESDILEVEGGDAYLFFDKEYGFTELRNFLKEFVGSYPAREW